MLVVIDVSLMSPRMTWSSYMLSWIINMGTCMKVLMVTLNSYMMKTRVVQTLNGHGSNMLIMDHVEGHGYFDGTLTTMVKALGKHV